MKVYVAYEVREKDYVVLNNLQVDFDCVKVFDNELKAKAWLMSELEFQCDEIEINGKVEFEKAEINQDDLWLAKVKEEENKISVEVRYCDEWQYDIILKEMEVE